MTKKLRGLGIHDLELVKDETASTGYRFVSLNKSENYGKKSFGVPATAFHVVMWDEIVALRARVAGLKKELKDVKK